MYIARQSLDDFNESSINYENAGNMTEQCSECGALMFKSEQSKSASKTTTSFSFCCSHGKVKIPPIKEPPNTLKTLLIGNTQKDHDFRQTIWAYNSSLALASLLLTGKEYNFATRGPYCYRINGQIYHLISQMYPKNGKAPGFSQIYIYNQEHKFDNPLTSFQGLDKSLLKELQDMINGTNHYANKYRTVGNIIKGNPTKHIQLVLKTTRQTVDPRRYNLQLELILLSLFQKRRMIYQVEM